MKKIKYIVLIISVFLIDQISKIIVMNTLSLDKSTSVIGDFFRLTYTHNNGAAFGLFGGKLALIIIVSLIVLCYLLYELFYHKKSGTLIKIASSLMISGLLGNLLDRIYFGYVRDFFDFKI